MKYKYSKVNYNFKTIYRLILSFLIRFNLYYIDTTDYDINLIIYICS